MNVEEAYPTACRQCGASFMQWREIPPGMGRCTKCRHSGLRGWLLAPAFLMVRTIGFCAGFFGRKS
jgi:hypothetical protein